MARITKKLTAAKTAEIRKRARGKNAAQLLAAMRAEAVAAADALDEAIRTAAATIDGLAAMLADAETWKRRQAIYHQVLIEKIEAGPPAGRPRRTEKLTAKCVEDALRRSGGNQAKAARSAGAEHQAFYNAVKRCGLRKLAKRLRAENR